MLPNGLVIPYPKPLSLRTSSSNADVAGTSEPPAKIDPANLGWRLNLPPVPSGSLRRLLIVRIIRMRAPRPFPRLQATALLLDNTIPMLKAPLAFDWPLPHK